MLLRTVIRVLHETLQALGFFLGQPKANDPIPHDRSSTPFNAV